MKLTLFFICMFVIPLYGGDLKQLIESDFHITILRRLKKNNGYMIAINSCNTVNRFKKNRDDVCEHINIEDIFSAEGVFELQKEYSLLDSLEGFIIHHSAFLNIIRIVSKSHQSKYFSVTILQDWLFEKLKIKKMEKV